MAHGDGVYSSETAIITISSCSSKRINHPAAFPCSHKQSSFVHTKAVDRRAFKTENPQTFSLAMIPQSHGAVGGAGVQHMLQRLHFQDGGCVRVQGGEGGGSGRRGRGGLLTAFAMESSSLAAYWNPKAQMSPDLIRELACNVPPVTELS